MNFLKVGCSSSLSPPCIFYLKDILRIIPSRYVCSIGDSRQWVLSMSGVFCQASLRNDSRSRATKSRNALLHLKGRLSFQARSFMLSSTSAKKSKAFLEENDNVNVRNMKSDTKTNSSDADGLADVQLEEIEAKTEKVNRRKPRWRSKREKSEFEKLIRDKKMLERKRTLGYLSKKHMERISAHPLPAYYVEQYREQLAKEVQNSDERWVEGEDNNDDEVVTSPSGRSLIFPLWCKSCDISVDSIPKTGGKSTSVSNILHQSMNMQKVISLHKWEKKMIAELGEDGFHKMKMEMFQEGHIVHANFQKFLDGAPDEELNLTPAVEGYWASATFMLKRLGPAVTHELNVAHTVLGYHGRTDCVASFDGKPSLIEWKTTRKPKSLKDCEDYLIQTVAYTGALNFDARYDTQVEQAVVVVTYKTGKEATVIVLNREECENYWRKWLRRLLEFRDLESIRKEFAMGKVQEWRQNTGQ